MYSPSTMSSRRATHYWYIHYFTTKEVFSAHTEYYRLQYRWVIQTTLPSIFVHGTQVVYTQTKADKHRISSEEEEEEEPYLCIVMYVYLAGTVPVPYLPRLYPVPYLPLLFRKVQPLHISNWPPRIFIFPYLK